MADLNKAYKIINAALEQLKSKVGIIEPRFNDFIIDWVKKFDTSGGDLNRTEKNKDRLKTFRRAMERFLLESGYNSMVTNFVRNFDELEANQQAVQKSLSGLKITKDFLSPFTQWAIEKTISEMQGQGLSLALAGPLQDELFTSIYQGGSLQDLLKSLDGKLNSTDERSGLMNRLITQAGRDALGQYNGVVNGAIRIKYKMDGIFYTGSLVRDSRPQCQRWTQEIETNGQLGLIPFVDIQAEIDWAYNNGTGMIPGTTPDNFERYRGGYNCRHDAYPVRLDSFN